MSFKKRGRRRDHTCRICLMAPNLPKISYISSAEMLKGKFRTNSTLRTSVDGHQRCRRGQ